MKQFHSFRLDTVNHCLWRGEERVSLAPKAFDVLRYLVEHADRLVTQDEILNALWPETYVNPEVIKKYVLGIRKALSDPRDKPEFVETFPRRGYQFVAPVSEVISGAPVGCGINTARKMVGREGAMAELDNYLSQALNSQRQVVFVTGGSGDREDDARRRVSSSNRQSSESANHSRTMCGGLRWQGSLLSRAGSDWPVGS